MAQHLIEDRFPAQRLRLVEWLKGLSALAQQLGDAEAPRTVEMLLGGLGEPFLFVVLGEIKTGKSRFLNALLGVPGLCHEDIEVHTAAVEKLDYGERESEAWISPQLKQRTAPAPLLKHLSIVDTPGTNSMVPAHEEITRQFLPRADLCIFVLLAKKPPSGSEWRLLDLIQNDWRKKLLFVLQQRDLLADEPEKLAKVVQRVRTDLAARGLGDAPVFCTSAKWEEQGREGSGFDELRAFIRDTVTGGGVQRLKLESARASAERELLRLGAALRVQSDRQESDEAVLARIRARLQESQRRSQEELRTLVARIIEHYRGLADKLLQDFERGMEVGSLLSRSVKGLWHSEHSVQRWLEGRQREFQAEVRGLVDEIAERRARDFIEDLRRLIEGLQEELSRLQQAPGAKDAELRWDRERDAVLEAVRKHLAALQQAQSFDQLFAENPAGIIPLAGAGGALAVLGTVAVAASNLVFFDITGGLLTASGLAIAGGYLLLKRPRVRREFRDNLERGEQRFREQLQALLGANLQHIHDKIDHGMKGLYQLIAEHKAHLSEHQQTLERLNKEHLELKTF